MRDDRETAARLRELAPAVLVDSANATVAPKAGPDPDSDSDPDSDEDFYARFKEPDNPIW